MKSYLSGAAALLLACCTWSAAAQDRPLKEPRVRFGIGWRYSLSLGEQWRVRTPADKYALWRDPYHRRGGTLRLEGTVRVAPQWNVGAGVGFSSLDAAVYKTFQGYAKAERIYGSRRNRWFNFAEAGVSFYPENGTGAMTTLGGGFRLAMTRRTRLDFLAGFEWLNLVGEAAVYDDDGVYVGSYPRGARFNRIGLTFGVAMHF